MRACFAATFFMPRAPAGRSLVKKWSTIVAKRAGCADSACTTQDSLQRANLFFTKQTHFSLQFPAPVPKSGSGEAAPSGKIAARTGKSDGE
jgi:hypothetical protein